MHINKTHFKMTVYKELAIFIQIKFSPMLGNGNKHLSK